MQGTSIGFSLPCVPSSCLRTKEQGVLGEQGIVGLEYLRVLVADCIAGADSADYRAVI